MTPGILSSQEIKSDFNLKMLNFSMGFNFYQLLNMFRMFEKISVQWLTLFIFRAAYLSGRYMQNLNFFLHYLDKKMEPLKNYGISW